MSGPDWLMIGVPMPPGVRVYASKELTEAELRSDLINHDQMYGDMGRSPYFERTGIAPIYRHTIAATMKTFVAIDAPTYGAALSTLFGQWSPEPDPVAIENPRPALGGGSGG